MIETLREAGHFTGAIGKDHQGWDFEKRCDFANSDVAVIDAFFRGVPGGRPFFAQVGYSDPHRPYLTAAADPPTRLEAASVPEYLRDTTAVRQDSPSYWDEIRRLDANIGTVLGSLKVRGLSGNTLVAFAGDHGLAFRRGKGTLYEAGIRNALIIRWPVSVTGGQTSDALASGVDLAATWLDVAGLSPLKSMQGGTAWYRC